MKLWIKNGTSGINGVNGNNSINITSPINKNHSEPNTSNKSVDDSDSITDGLFYSYLNELLGEIKTNFNFSKFDVYMIAEIVLFLNEIKDKEKEQRDSEISEFSKDFEKDNGFTIPPQIIAYIYTWFLKNKEKVDKYNKSNKETN